MAGFQLTSSQQSAIEAFKGFLASSDQVFMLMGAAGTGKTTLVSEFLKVIAKGNRNFCLMAPTGRAAYIIGSKTGKPATTIHKGIYGLNKLQSNNLSQQEEEDGSLHLRFELRDNSRASTNEVYIIDEASMVSDTISETEAFSFGSGKLLTDLFKYANGRKIVFVGDHAQLPPIGMAISPALNKDYIESNFHCRVSGFMLKEVVRQDSGSLILANANAIRAGIESKTFNEFRLQEGKDYVKENLNLLDSYYRLSENVPSPRAAIITYTNQQALDYNINIRQHYFGEKAEKEKVVPGELLMIARNNYSHKVELFNGNIVKVISAQNDQDVEIKNVRIKLGHGRIVEVTLQFRDVVIKFRQSGETIELPVKILDNFLYDPSGNITGILARALVVDFEQRLPQEIRGKLFQIRNHLRGKSSKDPDINKLAEAYIRKLFEDPYYNALICKYGYAMTCHKAQGGEWENVFVDLFRYGGNANEDYFRWAYTALTRASKKIHFFSAPDYDYISSLVVEQVVKSSNIKVSIYTETGSFLDERFQRMRRVAEKYGVSVTEDRSRNYQQWITLRDNANGDAVVNLWYNKEGYSDRIDLLRSSSTELTEVVKCVLDESYNPEKIPVDFSDRPFARKLFDYLSVQLAETGIKLLNVTKERYQDVYHLKTDGISKIGFHYNDLGRYTYLTLHSSLGEDDKLLQELRKKFV